VRESMDAEIISIPGFLGLYPGADLGFGEGGGLKERMCARSARDF